MPRGKGERPRRPHAPLGPAESAPVVLVDSCIWHHSFSRNVFRHLALAGAMQIRWSRAIESEWIRSVSRARPEIASSSLIAVRDRFRFEFPDGLAPELLPRHPLPRLPDPDDEHVLRAALVTRSSAICTSDRRGFPESLLRPLGIRAVSPGELLADCLQRRPTTTSLALHTHRTSLTRPPFTPQGYVQALRASSLILSDNISDLAFQALLRPHLSD